MVYRLAYQFAGNHHDAEDITQDVFIKVYRSLDRFRYDAQLTSWLYRIVMNACIDHKRRQTPAGGRHYGGRGAEDGQHSEEGRPETRPTAASSGMCCNGDRPAASGQRLVFTMRHMKAECRR